MSPLLEVEGLSKHFPLRGAQAWMASIRGEATEVRAVDNISFSVDSGETLGLVGESGCGKSTVARCVMRLVEPTAGRVRFDSDTLTALPAGAMRRARASIQMVFQDPTAALNPRMSVRRTIEEPLRLHSRLGAKEKRERADEVMDEVGIGQYLSGRYAHELSGGQRQRVNIARAIATHPRFVILDEPTSALDVSLRSRIILLLEHLRERFGLSYLFISHDIATVKYLAQRVAVMYLGTIVETASTDELFAHPLHPYTQALLSAVPVPDPDAERKPLMLAGEVPSTITVREGCPLRGRCPFEQEICKQPVPLREVADGHHVACHLV